MIKVYEVSRKYIMLFMHNNRYPKKRREIFLNISEIFHAKKTHEILHHYVRLIGTVASDVLPNLSVPCDLQAGGDELVRVEVGPGSGKVMMSPKFDKFLGSKLRLAHITGYCTFYVSFLNGKRFGPFFRGCGSP